MVSYFIFDSSLEWLFEFLVALQFVLLGMSEARDSFWQFTFVMDGCYHCQ